MKIIIGMSDGKKRLTGIEFCCHGFWSLLCKEQILTMGETFDGEAYYKVYVKDGKIKAPIRFCPVCGDEIFQKNKDTS